MFFIVFNIFAFATVLYVLWSFRSLGKVALVLLPPVLLAGLFKTYIYRWLGGGVFSPDLPREVIIALAWCQGYLWLLFVVVIIPLFVHLYPGSSDKLRRLTGYTLNVMYILCGVVIVCSGMQALKDPVLDTHALRLNKNYDFPHDLKIIQLTDTHISSLTDEKWFNQLIATVNERKPDLIFLTGDVADGDPKSPSPLVQRLSELKASIGIAVIPGNHEYYVDYQGWMERYRQMGFHVLENGRWSFKFGRMIIEVIGLTDEESALQAGNFEQPNIAKALGSEEKIKSGHFRILLKHRPQNADLYMGSKYGISLILSGHTHGGMVPWVQPLAKWMNSGFLRGIYRQDPSVLYVSDGTFLWNGFPFRLKSYNTIAEFTVISKDGS